MTAYVKPAIDAAGIARAIGDHLGEGATDVAPLSGGNLSSVFAFRHDGKDYIIKFSDMEHAYATERFVSQLLRKHGVPFPRCIGQGKSGQLVYSVMERVPGRNLIDCTALEQAAQRPEVIGLLTAMNHADVGDTAGFGWIRPDGSGAFPTWRDYVVSFFAEEQPGFWEGWRDIPGLELDVADECYARLLAFSAYNEPHRHFVHGDVSPWNMLSDGSRITGIIDGNFAYGDFVIDVATLRIMTGDANVEAEYRAHSEQLGIALPDFKERLIGAYYFKGLDGLRFFAKMGRENDYRHMRQFLLSLTS